MEIGELLLLTAYQVHVCRTQVLSTQKLMTINTTGHFVMSHTSIKYTKTDDDKTQPAIL